jgi:hypothetical protein
LGSRQQPVKTTADSSNEVSANVLSLEVDLTGTELAQEGGLEGAIAKKTD